MDTLATVCPRNTNVIMVAAWVLCRPYALGTYYCFGMDALVTVCSGNTNVIMVAAHERYYGLGMDALVSVSSPNSSESMAGGRMPERSPMVLSCPAPKYCEYGHKMASGSLGSARNPTPVSEIQLLRPLQKRAVTPGWSEEPGSCGCSRTYTPN